MAWFATAIGAPFLILLSLPLAIFAVITTTLAFWVLFIRASLVYVALFAALLRAYVAPASITVGTVQPSAPAKESSLHAERRTIRPGSGHFSTARLKSHSLAALAPVTPLRDYEGVGGWRLHDGDEDGALWLRMNSRLELPGTPLRRHQRSLTNGSRLSSGSASPDFVRTPLVMRTADRRRGSGSGAVSPEEYFGLPFGFATGGSGASPEQRRKRGSSSSMASF